MEINKQELTELFEQYSNAFYGIEQYQKYIHKRYRQKYNLSGYYYIMEVQDITQDCIKYNVKDNENDEWPFRASDVERNDGLTIDQICMEESEWQLYIDNYREQIKRLEQDKKTKTLLKIAEQKEQQRLELYLKLKKEYQGDIN